MGIRVTFLSIFVSFPNSIPIQSVFFLSTAGYLRCLLIVPLGCVSTNKHALSVHRVGGQ